MKAIFSVDSPEDSPGFLLWQATIIWQRLIKKTLDPYSISHTQFVILAITLWFENKDQEISQNLIIRQSKLDKMTVSKALKNLVLEGYIQGLEHKQDTRVKSVHLTKKGKELACQLVPIIEKVDEGFFGVLKETDRKQLISALNKIIRSNQLFVLDTHPKS